MNYPNIDAGFMTINNTKRHKSESILLFCICFVFSWFFFGFVFFDKIVGVLDKYSLNSVGYEVLIAFCSIVLSTIYSLFFTFFWFALWRWTSGTEVKAFKILKIAIMKDWNLNFSDNDFASKEFLEKFIKMSDSFKVNSVSNNYVLEFFLKDIDFIKMEMVDVKSALQEIAGDDVSSVPLKEFEFLFNSVVWSIVYEKQLSQIKI